jgi:tetratricopeptide (TPR) repeat protein
MLAKLVLLPYLVRAFLATIVVVSFMTNCMCAAENVVTHQSPVPPITSNKAHNSGSRTLIFPDEAIGDLQIFDGPRLIDVRPARGKITVPKQSTVLLKCIYEVAGKLPEALQRLGPADLYELVLSTSNVSNRDLSAVGKLYGLQRLSLSHTGVGDAELKNLAKLGELRTLSLNDSFVGDTGIGYLAKMNKLWLLDLSRTRVTSATLPKLSTLTSLKELFIDHTSVTDAHLEELTHLPMLTHLFVDGDNITDDGVKKLSQLRHLYFLNLSGTKVTSRGISYLKRMNHLRELNLASTQVDDSALPALLSLPLESLSVCNTKISRVGLDHLRINRGKCSIESSVSGALQQMRAADDIKNPKDLSAAEAILKSRLHGESRTLECKRRIDLWHRLISIQIKLEKNDEAIKSYEQVMSDEIKGGSAYSDFLRESLVSFHQYWQGRPAVFAKATQVLERLIQLSPQNKVSPQLYVEVADLCSRLKRSAQYQKYSRRALAALNGDAENANSKSRWSAWQQLAETAERQGRQDLSLKYHKQACVEAMRLPVNHKLCSMYCLGRDQLLMKSVSQSRATLQAMINESLQKPSVPDQFSEACILLIRCNLMQHNPGRAREVLTIMESTEEKKLALIRDVDARIEGRLRQLELLHEVQVPCVDLGYPGLARDTASLMKEVANSVDFSYGGHLPWLVAWKQLFALSIADDKEVTEVKLKPAIRAAEDAGQPRSVEDAKLIVDVLYHVPAEKDASVKESLLEKCVQVYDNKYGSESAESIPALRLLLQNDLDGKGKRLGHHVAQVISAKKKSGAYDPELVGLLVRQAQDFLGRDKYAESFPVLRETEALAQKVEGRDSANYGYACLLAGQAYEKLGKHADAEREFLKALAVAEPLKDKRPDDYASALGYLGNVYDYMHRPDKGLVVRQKSAETIAKTGGELARASLGPSLGRIASELILMQRKDELIPVYHRLLNLPHDYTVYPEDLAAIRQYLKLKN